MPLIKLSRPAFERLSPDEKFSFKVREMLLSNERGKINGREPNQPVDIEKRIREITHKNEAKALRESFSNQNLHDSRNMELLSGIGSMMSKQPGDVSRVSPSHKRFPSNHKRSGPLNESHRLLHASMSSLGRDELAEFLDNYQHIKKKYVPTNMPSFFNDTTTGKKMVASMTSTLERMGDEAAKEAEEQNSYIEEESEVTERDLSKVSPVKNASYMRGKLLLDEQGIKRTLSVRSSRLS